MFNFLRRQQWYHLFGCETTTNRAITAQNWDYLVYLRDLAVHKDSLPHHKTTSQLTLEWWRHLLTVKLHKIFTWWHQWSLCKSSDSCARTSRNCTFKLKGNTPPKSSAYFFLVLYINKHSCPKNFPWGHMIIQLSCCFHFRQGKGLVCHEIRGGRGDTSETRRAKACDASFGVSD